MANILFSSRFRRSLLSLLLLVVSIFFANHVAVAAYSIDWRWVQHRVYENSPDPVYRAGFGLKDSAGNYVTDPSIVTNIVLRDPSQNVVSVTNPSFAVYYEEDGSYDGTWTTDKSLYTASDFGGTLQGPLAVGTYTLEVTLRGGSKLTKQYTFNQEVDLPIISSSTFGVTSNGSGDFCVQWQGVTSAQYPNTSQRAHIDFYNSGTFVAELFATVPTDTHEVCIPRSVLKTLTSSIGPFDQAKFRLHLRTDDNNNRSYSNFYSLDLNLTTSYYVDSFSVQHRLYESPSDSAYRLWFTAKDSTGNHVTDESIVTTYVLRNPSGSALSYTDPFFEVYYREDGYYDGTWRTDAPLYTTSDYGATLQGPLAVGKYTVEVSFIDGSKHSRQYGFNAEVDLPIISSSTFSGPSNTAGSFCVQWLGVTSAQYPDTSQRAFIDFYNTDKFVAEFWVTVPTDVHEVCIPRSLLRTFTRSIGTFDDAKFRLQLRTNDNNNRSYSNYYPVDLQAGPRALPFLQLLLEN